MSCKHKGERRPNSELTKEYRKNLKESEEMAREGRKGLWGTKVFK
jgi:endonuclease YncB( thermonuclease family)